MNVKPWKVIFIWVGWGWLQTLILSQEWFLLFEYSVTQLLFLSNELLGVFGCIKQLNTDHSAKWFQQRGEEDWGEFSEDAFLVSSQP